MWLDEVFHRHGGQWVKCRGDGAAAKQPRENKTITQGVGVFSLFVIGNGKEKMFYTDRTSQKKLMYLRAALNKHAINSPGSPGNPCSISMTKYITICGEPKVHSAFQFHQIYNYGPALAAQSFGTFDPQSEPNPKTLTASLREVASLWEWSSPQ